MKGINYALFCLLIIVLPYPWRIANYVIIAWLIAWALEFRWLLNAKEHWHCHPWREKVPFLLLAVLVAWETLSMTWSVNPSDTALLLERHILLVAIPLVACFGVNEHYQVKTLLPLLVKTAVYSVPVYIFTSVMVHNGWQAYYDLHHYGDLRFPPLLFMQMTGHIKHHTFYCMALILALCAFPYIYRTHVQYPKWSRIATLGMAALVIITGIVMTNSRATWLLLLVLPIVWILLHLRGKKLAMVLSGSALLSVLAVVLLYLYAPRFDQMTDDPRIMEWKTYFAHHDDYTFLGTGAGTAQNVMVSYYEQDGGEFVEGIVERYSVHNQYFNSRLTMGPLAVIFVTLIFISLMVGYWHSARWWAVAVSLIYLLSMLSDDILERLDPIMILLTAMTICLVVSKSSVAQD